eukprot:NODE_136_length_3544_cov_8.120574.p1 GENE.NODE_136_length_3544_cov_8.120574~~NODE_136_length_3544_cov_8.120574.p1  ORF type:complete len:641 (-),score=81.82 NODE_136_length_3544_cov_8.120574:390-2312(-)
MGSREAVPLSEASVVLNIYDLWRTGDVSRVSARRTPSETLHAATILVHGCEYYYSHGLQVAGASDFVDAGVTLLSNDCLGIADLSAEDVQALVSGLSARFAPEHFDIFLNNSFDFAREFVRKLLPEVGLPGVLRHGCTRGCGVMDTWSAWYNMMAEWSPQMSWTMMNYGFANTDLQVQTEQYALNMYKDLVRAGGGVRGARVLEIGCGRGGGCAFVRSFLGAAEVVGVDYAERQVALCRSRYSKVDGLVFLCGDAMNLNLPAASFDVVLNVESSHCYSSVPKFLAEVSRVLRPGGRFMFVDFRGTRDGLASLRAQLNAAPALRMCNEEDISASVVRALDFDSARKEAMISDMLPPLLHGAAHSFAGTRRSKTFVGFSSGAWRYMRVLLEKAEDQGAASTKRRTLLIESKRRPWSPWYQCACWVMVVCYTLVGLRGLPYFAAQVFASGTSWDAHNMTGDLWRMSAVYLLDVFFAALGFITMSVWKREEILEHHLAFLVFVIVSLVYSNVYKDTYITERLVPSCGKRWFTAALLSNLNEVCYVMVRLMPKSATLKKIRLFTTTISLCSLMIFGALDTACFIYDCYNDYDIRVALLAAWFTAAVTFAMRRWVAWVKIPLRVHWDVFVVKRLTLSDLFDCGKDS